MNGQTASFKLTASSLLIHADSLKGAILVSVACIIALRTRTNAIIEADSKTKKKQQQPFTFVIKLLNVEVLIWNIFRHFITIRFSRSYFRFSNYFFYPFALFMLTSNGHFSRCASMASEIRLFRNRARKMRGLNLIIGLNIGFRLNAVGTEQSKKG